MNFHHGEWISSTLWIILVWRRHKIIRTIKFFSLIQLDIDDKNITNIHHCAKFLLHWIHNVRQLITAMEIHHCDENAVLWWKLINLMKSFHYDADQLLYCKLITVMKVYQCDENESHRWIIKNYVMKIYDDHYYD